jgi:hypothetical protein
VRKLYISSLIMALCVIASVRLAAQQPAPANTPPAPDFNRQAFSGDDVVPLQIDVVISRYGGEKGDKKISSVPYTLAVNAMVAAPPIRPLTRLRMGGRVPVPTQFGVAPQPKDGQPAPAPMTSMQYIDVGTNIDCRAGILRDGRFDVSVTIEESTIADANEVAGAVRGGPPVVRSLQASNNLILRDGQTRQFTAATDRVTGEVVKIDVTLKVVK